MADIKISALPAATAVTATDVAPLVSGGNTTKATAAQMVTAALNATPAALTQGGTGATTAAAARTALGVKTFSPTVPTLAASLNTAQAIAEGVQTALVFDTFTTQTITGLTWNATKKGFVNGTGTVMNLIVAAQSWWAASTNGGLRAEYIRVYSSADVLLSQYAQELDYQSAGTGVPDYNSSCSPVVIPAGAYMSVYVVQSGEATLNNGGMSPAGTPGTTITAMQLFSGV